MTKKHTVYESNALGYHPRDDEGEAEIKQAQANEEYARVGPQPTEPAHETEILRYRVDMLTREVGLLRHKIETLERFAFVRVAS